MDSANCSAIGGNLSLGAAYIWEGYIERNCIYVIYT